MGKGRVDPNVASGLTRGGRPAEVKGRVFMKGKAPRRSTVR